LNKVFSGVKPKSLMGRTLNGEMLATLIKSYVDALNSGGVPEINSAWSRVVATQCQEALAFALESYNAAMFGELLKAKNIKQSNEYSKQDFSSIDALLPLDTQVILRCHEAAKSSAKVAYRSKVSGVYI
jgi:hypothetical protein